MYLIRKTSLIKCSKLLHSKETTNKVKRQPSECEKIITKETTDKGLISKIYKQLIQLNTRNTNNSIKKWETNTWKDAQHRSLLEKCKLKLQWDITPNQSEWPSSKSLQTINAGEGVEKREHSCTVRGNVNWYSHYGRQYRDSLKNWNKTTIWPNNPTPRHILWGNQNWKRHMYPLVHCNTIYNS